MRKWINLVEDTVGKLYGSDMGEAVGYWYHPKTGKHYTIAWEHGDGETLHTDHADVVMDHPEWFGISEEEAEEWDDADTARFDAILKGWVRLGYNTAIGVWLDAKTPRDAYLAVQWLVKHHGEPKGKSGMSISINIEKGYVVPRDDVPEYLSNGRLQPAWKTR